MTGEELDLLIHGWFEKTLSPEEEGRLWETLRSDPAAADRFAEMAEIESGLVESMKADEEMPEEIRPRPSRRAVRSTPSTGIRVLAALAALVIVAVTLALFMGPKPAPETARSTPVPPPVVESEDRELEELRRKARAEMAERKRRLEEIERERVRLVEAREQAVPEQKPRIESRLAEIEVERKEETAKLEKAAETVPAKTVVAVVERAEGSPSAKAGDTLGAGEGVDAGLAVLKFADGTLVEVRGALRLAGAKDMTLSRGSLSASVTKQSAGIVFRTPNAEVRVLGTRLTIAIAGDATRVEVQEGRVRVRRLPDGLGADVAAGQFVVVAKGAPLAAKPVTLVRSFQDGIAPTPDYAGTRDTSISNQSLSSNLGTLEALRMHKANDAQSAALLKWDVSSLPAGSRVLSAEVTVWVTGAVQGSGYRVFDARRPWEELEATWKVYAGSHAWQTPGAQADLDRGSKPLGVVTPATSPGLYTFALGEVLVQAWVNAPAGNFGIVVASSALNNAWEFNSRESTPPERRPRLSVTYIPVAGR